MITTQLSFSPSAVRTAFIKMRTQSVVTPGDKLSQTIFRLFHLWKSCVNLFSTRLDQRRVSAVIPCQFAPYWLVHNARNMRRCFFADAVPGVMSFTLWQNEKRSCTGSTKVINTVCKSISCRMLAYCAYIDRFSYRIEKKLMMSNQWGIFCWVLFANWFDFQGWHRRSIFLWDFYFCIS